MPDITVLGVMLSDALPDAIVLGVIMQSVTMPGVIKLGVIVMRSVAVPDVILLGVIMPNVTTPVLIRVGVIILCVVLQQHMSECNGARCHSGVFCCRPRYL